MRFNKTSILIAQIV